MYPCVVMQWSVFGGFELYMCLMRVEGSVSHSKSVQTSGHVQTLYSMCSLREGHREHVRAGGLFLLLPLSAASCYFLYPLRLRQPRLTLPIFVCIAGRHGYGGMYYRCIVAFCQGAVIVQPDFLRLFVCKNNQDKAIQETAICNTYHGV
jgi:hypothetical protein